MNQADDKFADSDAKHVIALENAMTAFEARLIGHLEVRLGPVSKPKESVSSDVRSNPPPAWQNSTANDSYQQPGMEYGPCNLALNIYDAEDWCSIPYDNYDFEND